MIQFLHEIEKLKCELRHSWLSDGRQESVAERILGDWEYGVTYGSKSR